MAADPQAVLYRYDAKKNTTPAVKDAQGVEVRPAETIAYLPGVPLRDLTREDWEALPEHTQAAVAGSDFYVATEHAPKRKAPKAEE
jgi:hypothetical protein